MLEIKNVYKTFNAGTVNEKVALQDLNLTLEDGDFVTVIGGNGAGKSTMLNAVAGVWPIDMGKILIDGQDVTRLSEHQRAKYIGRVFQDPMMGTAALDPKTAAKVLALSEKIVQENHLTTLMITHNMKDAIKYGNRLIMMYEGHVIYDVRGEEKANLQVSDLLQRFEQVSDGGFANDRMLLS